MADPLFMKGYYAAKVTLTASPQSIMALLAAAYATNPPPNMAVKQLNLTADAGNSTNNCLIGDEKLTTSNYGDQLPSAAGASRVIYGPFEVSAIPIQDMFAMASGGSPALLIEVIV